MMENQPALNVPSEPPAAGKAKVLASDAAEAAAASLARAVDSKDMSAVTSAVAAAMEQLTAAADPAPSQRVLGLHGAVASAATAMELGAHATAAAAAATAVAREEGKEEEKEEGNPIAALGLLRASAALLAALCGGSERNAQLLGAQQPGAVGALCVALRGAGPGDAALQAAGFGVLKALCTKHDAGKALFASADGGSAAAAAVACLRAHAGAEAGLREALGAMRAAATPDDRAAAKAARGGKGAAGAEAASAALVGAGALPALTALLVHPAHASEPGVLATIYALLLRLAGSAACEGGAHVVLRAESGGGGHGGGAAAPAAPAAAMAMGPPVVCAVVEALAAHAAHAALARHALALLRQYTSSGSDAEKAALCAGGGFVDALGRAMRCHLRGSAPTLEQALGLVAALALRLPANVALLSAAPPPAAAAAAAGAAAEAEAEAAAAGRRSSREAVLPSLLLGAMRAHPTSAPLQRQACHALRNIASRLAGEAKAALLASGAGDAEALLRVAQRAKGCAPQAEAALTALGCPAQAPEAAAAAAAAAAAPSLTADGSVAVGGGGSHYAGKLQYGHGFATSATGDVEELLQLQVQAAAAAAAAGGGGAAGSGGNVTEAGSFLLGNPEKCDLNQYWYSRRTIDAFALEAADVVAAGGTVAFLSTPSIYFALTEGQRAAAAPAGSAMALAAATTGGGQGCRVFEYDRQWEADAGFVFFDFNALGEDCPPELLGAFDMVVVDPPFITREVWEKYAVATKRLLRPAPAANGGACTLGGPARLICTTVQESAPWMAELLGVSPVRFQPSIPNLVYQYHTYTNYASERLGKPNPDVPE